MLGVSETARLLDAPWSGADVQYTGCGTDTRTLAPGALFVALKGEHRHGHEFLEQAHARGAAAALVERGDIHILPAIVVADARRALGDLAAAWRARFDCPMVAVTGSNGKTTVKEMLAAILGDAGPVLYTRGNLNNDIGLPLTLTSLDRGHRFAVLEMGANHAGEITNLARIAAPAVGIITQCAPAHLEGFGSVEGVARAKGELIQGLTPGGTAVINADDPYAGLWRELAGSRRILTFGLEHPADVTGSWQPGGTGSRIELHTPAGFGDVDLSLPGRHNVMNALAAAAGALALGVELETIRAGLARAPAVKGRLQIKRGPRGARILDDTYNANPASLAAGLEVLSGLPGRRWVALGEMAELGAATADYHTAAGHQIRAAGAERAYAVGDHGALVAAAFGEGGRTFPSQDDLIDALRDEVQADVSLLVKGSRSARMERVVAALVEEG